MEQHRCGFVAASTAFLASVIISFFTRLIYCYVSWYIILGPCFLDEDIDYPGMDLNLATGSTSDRKKSALECRALCNETPLCKFFTWKADINECWIKDGISRKENQIGATSGSACREGKYELFKHAVHKRW